MCVPHAQLAFSSVCAETNGPVCESTAVGRASRLCPQDCTAVPSPGSRKWRGLGRQLKLLAEQGGRFSVCVWGRCDSACLGLYPIVATSN